MTSGNAASYKQFFAANVTKKMRRAGTSPVGVMTTGKGKGGGKGMTASSRLASMGLFRGKSRGQNVAAAGVATQQEAEGERRKLRLRGVLKKAVRKVEMSTCCGVL